MHQFEKEQEEEYTFIDEGVLLLSLILLQILFIFNFVNNTQICSLRKRVKQYKCP